MSASLNVFNIRSGMQKVFFIKKHRTCKLAFNTVLKTGFQLISFQEH